MDAEADDKSGDRVNGMAVAMTGVGVVLVVVFLGLMLLFAAGAVIMPMFGTLGELFQ